MAREREPVTDAEIEVLREAVEDQREELLDALAEDLGGDPEDYRSENVYHLPAYVLGSPFVFSSCFRQLFPLPAHIRYDDRRGTL